MDVYLQPQDLQPGDLGALEALARDLPAGEFQAFIDYLHQSLAAGHGVHIYSKEQLT